MRREYLENAEEEAPESEPAGGNESSPLPGPGGAVRGPIGPGLREALAAGPDAMRNELQRLNPGAYSGKYPEMARTFQADRSRLLQSMAGRNDDATDIGQPGPVIFPGPARGTEPDYEETLRRETASEPANAGFADTIQPRAAAPSALQGALEPMRLRRAVESNAPRVAGNWLDRANAVQHFENERQAGRPMDQAAKEDYIAAEEQKRAAKLAAQRSSLQQSALTNLLQNVQSADPRLAASAREWVGRLAGDPALARAMFGEAAEADFPDVKQRNLEARAAEESRRFDVLGERDKEKQAFEAGEKKLERDALDTRSIREEATKQANIKAKLEADIANSQATIAALQEKGGQESAERLDKERARNDALQLRLEALSQREDERISKREGRATHPVNAAYQAVTGQTGGRLDPERVSEAFRGPVDALVAGYASEQGQGNAKNYIKQIETTKDAPGAKAVIDDVERNLMQQYPDLTLAGARAMINAVMPELAQLAAGAGKTAAGRTPVAAAAEKIEAEGRERAKTTAEDDKLLAQVMDQVKGESPAVSVLSGLTKFTPTEVASRLVRRAGQTVSGAADAPAGVQGRSFQASVEKRLRDMGLPQEDVARLLRRFNESY